MFQSLDIQNFSSTGWARCPSCGLEGFKEAVERGNLLFSEARRIVETGQDILASEPRILSKEIIDGVAAGQHVDDLMDRDPRTFHARLAVANAGVDGDAIVHGRRLPPEVTVRGAPR